MSKDERWCGRRDPPCSRLSPAWVLRKTECIWDLNKVLWLQRQLACQGLGRWEPLPLCLSRRSLSSREICFLLTLYRIFPYHLLILLIPYLGNILSDFSKDKLLPEMLRKQDMQISSSHTEEFHIHSSAWLSCMCFFLSFFNEILERNFIHFLWVRKWVTLLEKKMMAETG